ncbi:hypothetical protein L9D05_000896 [Klebsiella aerogenes]|nr:hypothetical protein [Klebsiella aerogenes]
MKKIIILFLCILVISACGDKTDDQLKIKAKSAVEKYLQDKYSPADCQRWLSIADNNLASKSKAIAVCDNGFNVTKGLEYTNIEVYRNGKDVSVCGVVSGYTDKSKIGAKFVYTINDNEKITLKMSKYPVLLSGDKASRLLAAQMIESLNDIERISCK